jgi:anti-sigma28 factor (negative regulator of flagellin synthesis)
MICRFCFHALQGIEGRVHPDFLLWRTTGRGRWPNNRLPKMSRQKKPRLKRASVLRYDDWEEDPLSSSELRETGNPAMHVPGLKTAADASTTRSGSSPESHNSEQITESNPPENREETPAEPDSEAGQDAEPRARRLARIKAEIEAGEYDTQDKLDAAFSRLFEEIGLDEGEDSSR